jgi:NAD(P)-dependent dehydrogenase (short-subunit alcohol dehydrogenase family)
MAAAEGKRRSLTLRELDSRTVALTGATDGLGRYVAKRLAEKGASLIIIARNEEKARHLIEEIGSGSLVIADLASLASIDTAADRIATNHRRIDILINNAGVIKRRLEVSSDGYEMTVMVNHIAVAALTLRLLPQFLAVGHGARIINTNSAGHAAALRRGGEITPAIDTWRGGDTAYEFTMAYSRSKLANLLWTYELAERLGSSGVTVNAVHPGAVRTALDREVPKLLSFIFHTLFASTSPAKGAEPLVHLATSKELEGVSGAYFDRFRRVPSSPRSYDLPSRRKVWVETAKITELDFPTAAETTARRSPLD